MPLSKIAYTTVIISLLNISCGYIFFAAWLPLIMTKVLVFQLIKDTTFVLMYLFSVENHQRIWIYYIFVLVMPSMDCKIESIYSLENSLGNWGCAMIIYYEDKPSLYSRTVDMTTLIPIAITVFDKFDFISQ